MKKCVCALLLIMTLGGCITSENEGQSLARALNAHLDAARAAQTQAERHWEQLADGASITCQTGLGLPAPFNLTQIQADRYPQTVPIRDNLNYGIVLLTASAQVWDSYCSDEESVIPLADINGAYHNARDAGLAFDEAERGLSVWQP